MINNNASEVARLRAQIEMEIVSMAHASGFAVVARHDIIHASFHRIEQHMHSLEAVVGEQDATNMLCELYNNHNK